MCACLGHQTLALIYLYRAAHHEYQPTKKGSNGPHKDSLIANTMPSPPCYYFISTTHHCEGMVDMSLLLRPVHHDVRHHEVLALDQEHGVLGLEDLKGIQHLVVGSRLWSKQKWFQILLRHSLVPIPHPKGYFTVVAENVLNKQISKSEKVIS